MITTLCDFCQAEVDTQGKYGRLEVINIKDIKHKYLDMCEACVRSIKIKTNAKKTNKRS